MSRAWATRESCINPKTIMRPFPQFISPPTTLRKSPLSQLVTLSNCSSAQSDKHYSIYQVKQPSTTHSVLYRSNKKPEQCSELLGPGQILTYSGGAYPRFYGSHICLGHKMVFGTYGPGENPPKLLRLRPISLVNGMIAQIRLKKYFFARLMGIPHSYTKFALK